MTTEFNIARKKKDKNYDGTFFFGVKTTGIFCRPSCPSPVAKEANVVYFNSLFEAIDHGFRPCYRCRPDIEVDYYNGNINGVLIVKTALEMIYNGYLSYHSIGDLSKEIGVSDRHLRKVFVDNLGIPPVKVAKYHKALFAKKLLSFSDQSITDIAFASGFGSLRQFNSVFKEIFGLTPTAARQNAQTKIKSKTNTTLLLKYKKPFDFSQMLSFIKTREIKGVEVVEEKRYSRTFRTKNTKGFFEVINNKKLSALELTIFCEDVKCYMEIYNRVRGMFDLDTDFLEINNKFAEDKILSKGMYNGHVPRLPLSFDPFEFTTRAVLGQQISVKAATTLAGRVAEKAGIKCTADFPEGLDYFFPSPEELLNTNLGETGITTTRQETLKTVAAGILNDGVSLSPNQSFEKFHKDFSALKGIGDWTVNYVAMRGLGMKDCFPDNDLGVIKVLTPAKAKPPKKEILKMAEKWRPYRSYATLCLWNYR